MRSRSAAAPRPAPSRQDVPVLAASSSRVQAEPRSLSSAHCTSSSTSTSPESGAISAVQQMIGACSLTRSSPVTRPTAPRRAARSGAMRLLGLHPERRREDSLGRGGLGEELERGVRLWPSWCGPTVRDDRLRLPCGLDGRDDSRAPGRGGGASRLGARRWPAGFGPHSGDRGAPGGRATSVFAGSGGG
jgi:hypothetical protein